MPNVQNKQQRNLREVQVKFIHNRVINTEKQIADLCRSLTIYTLNCARLRDSSDTVSQVLTQFSDVENINKSLANGLKKMSHVLSQLGDSRDIEVKCLEERVLNKLAIYEDKCKYARTDVNTISGAFQKEISRRKECDKIKLRNPKSSQLNLQAESEFAKAQADVVRKLKIIEEKMQVFEEQKVKDLKSIFQCMILGQLRHCAKSMELLTVAYNDVDKINEQEDVQSFLDVLFEPENLQRLETVKKISTSNSSLNSIGGLFTTQPKNQQPSEKSNHPGTVVTPVEVFEDDDDKEEEEDSTQKTNSSKSQTNVIQKIKSLAT